VNRTDLALGTHDVYWADDADAEWVSAHGRGLRKRARLSAAHAAQLQTMPIRDRMRGWRRYGEPRGYSFAPWSPWLTAEGYRAQLHLAVLAGSVVAARQLSLALVDDLTEAA
jgi:hypothetical protein